MHLKQLKIAGFKSFVDPTVLHFPSQLVAVVGPNGCGKSNIIDAVRWVMGESSAKNLRGEAMTDVIFNGSSNRKPVGQALVELIFDNSLGRVVGPFASYGEIAVKRVVTRAGESNYFLNGSRCRRRDITDIFLGTGAGARSYSIIGQGTVSRLIEAKPEELRAFLEEAAGVSKYKERRRETLQRISHTQENLVRVADIREELDKQLQRLERQAKAAERYTVLKQEESLCRAEIMAIKWRDFHQQQEIKQKKIQELALYHEEQQASLTSQQKQKILLTEQQYQANEQVQQIQATFYQVGTEIARLEEHIQQQRREHARREHDRQQLQTDWQQAQTQIKEDEEQLQIGQQRLSTLNELHIKTQEELSTQESIWTDAQHSASLWNIRWEEVQNKHRTHTSERELLRVKQSHATQNKQNLLVRLERIDDDKKNYSLTDFEARQRVLEEEQHTQHEQHALLEKHFKEQTGLSKQLREELVSAEHLVQQKQKEFHRVHGEYEALNARQKAVLDEAIVFEQNAEWTRRAKLAEQLEVDSEWQKACEFVLGDDLHAYVAENVAELLLLGESCEREGKTTITLTKKGSNPSTKSRLIDKIKNFTPVTSQNVQHIYAATSWDQAQEWLPNLESGESIILPSGLWIGSGWIKAPSLSKQKEQGLLSRQQKINELADLVSSLENDLAQLQEQCDTKKRQLQELSQLIDSLQERFNESLVLLQSKEFALDKCKQERQHAEQLLTNYQDQEHELRIELEDVSEQSVLLDEQLYSIEQLIEEQGAQYIQMAEEKDLRTEAQMSLRKALDATRKQFHDIELDCERERMKMQQLASRLERDHERMIAMQERLEQLALTCMQAVTPEKEMQERLREQLVVHHELEEQLVQSRERFNQVKIDCEQIEKNSVLCDEACRNTQALIAQERMQEHELSVRASAIQESLSELQYEVEVLCATLPLETTQSSKEEDLLNINEKIKRLGAINLAAIEEFTNEQQRKLYLDEQYADLNEALETLQMAIDKMDKETKIRLESTFDQVNSSFKALFPRLFGGGRAQLELTCDNLLDAGIVVMAQPPGKRNSTIHLLSGGEKAMTAVALVFAIFQLNPSPFCMLDEVDAPLDDVNVGRFCDLVKEMSQLVQFLFITHNKVTMELADHLIGVTMREPGVSRLVAVDVKEALMME